jgi:hypothetical protein
MSKKKDKLTPEQSLAKMKSILANHVKQRRKIGRQLHRIEQRLNGATKEILKRRFQFDIDQLKEQLNEVKAKEAWAQRMVQTLKIICCTNKEGDLIQKPFTKLAGLKLN